MKAFLHETSHETASDEDDASPLLSPSLSSLTLSQSEVASAFHLPLSRLTDPRYLREHHFRESSPYWACDVTDLAVPGTEWSNTGANVMDEADGGVNGRLEIWGLTGWYLNLLLEILLSSRRH